MLNTNDNWSEKETLEKFFNIYLKFISSPAITIIQKNIQRLSSTPNSLQYKSILLETFLLEFLLETIFFIDSYNEYTVNPKSNKIKR